MSDFKDFDKFEFTDADQEPFGTGTDLTTVWLCEPINCDRYTFCVCIRSPRYEKENVYEYLTIEAAVADFEHIRRTHEHRNLTGKLIYS